MFAEKYVEDAECPLLSTSQLTIFSSLPAVSFVLFYTSDSLFHRSPFYLVEKKKTSVLLPSLPRASSFTCPLFPRQSPCLPQLTGPLYTDSCSSPQPPVVTLVLFLIQIFFYVCVCMYASMYVGMYVSIL